MHQETSVLITLIKLDCFTPEVNNTEGDRESVRIFLSKVLDRYTSLDAQKIDAFLWKKKKIALYLLLNLINTVSVLF